MLAQSSAMTVYTVHELVCQHQARCTPAPLDGPVRPDMWNESDDLVRMAQLAPQRFSRETPGHFT
jgi:hypothetical protein